MKPNHLITSLTKIICASYLLFFTLIYSSCNQKRAASQPEMPAASVPEKPVVTVDTAAGPSLNGPVNSAAETVMRYDQMMKEYREIAKMMKDTANLSNPDYMAAMVKKVAWLKNEGRPAGNYFSTHRKEFSKKQIKKIFQDIDEIDKATKSMAP